MPDTFYRILFASLLVMASCTQEVPQTLETIADARIHKAKFIDIGELGDSVGDILTFDQPLLKKRLSRSATIAAHAYAHALVTAFNANGP